MATLQELIESEIGDFFAGFGSPGEPETPEDMQSQLLARIAPLIASLEREPVAYMQIDGDEIEYNGHNEFSGGGKGVPLYAAPQLPQPAVPDAIEPTLEAIKAILPTANPDHYACCVGADMWNACRAAMLQGAELVQGWIPCSERMPDADGNYWGWWSESKRQGPVWFIKSELQAQFQSSEITHWMPLPACPKGE